MSCPFCGSARITYPCINGQPGDECKCGECGRVWPFKFIEFPGLLLAAPASEDAMADSPGTSTPSVQDVLGDCGEVCHGESLLHAVGSEMGLSRGGSPLEKFAGERGSVERQPTMARGAHSPDSPAIQDSYTGQLIDELTCAVVRAEERAGR